MPKRAAYRLSLKHHHDGWLGRTLLAAAAKKLSYKQKFALETLPGKMAAVSASISTLENQLADPAFYEKNPASFAKTIAALDKDRQSLAAMEEEWLASCRYNGPCDRTRVLCGKRSITCRGGAGA